MASSFTVGAWFLAIAHLGAAVASQSVIGLHPCSTSKCRLSILTWNLNLQLRRIAIQKWRQQRPKICSVHSLCVASVARAFVFMPGLHPPLIGLPFLRFYAVASNLFVQFVRFVYVFYFFLFIATMFFAGYFLVRSLLSAFPAYLRTYFRFDLVWFHLSCDHGWVRSGSVNVR